MLKTLGLVAVATLAIAAVATPASAKSARCYTSDDGYFPCNFTATDSDGSFEIRRRDGVGFSLVMDRPGFGFGYYLDGDDSTALPGEYVRSRDDGACWNNPENSAKVCAW
jgi:hypothetical protein